MSRSSATATQRSPLGETPVSAEPTQTSPRVAVVVASRHGATLEIGEAIRGHLSSAGLRANLFIADDFESFEGADAVVLGSAMYAGHWLRSAQELMDRNRAELSRVPVWLFSSGPVGDTPIDASPTPAPIVEAAAEIGARDSRVFAGKIDVDQLGFGERSVVRLMRVEHGDFRDWDAIGSWADGIAMELNDRALNAHLAAPYIQAGNTA